MVYASRLTPMEAILMGILVEHQKALARLQVATQQLERAGQPPADPPAQGLAGNATQRPAEP
jgi:hypothetical protein